MIDKTEEIEKQIAMSGYVAANGGDIGTRDTGAAIEVLILEDFDLLRQGCRALLEKTMYSVNIHEASSYEEAVTLLSSVKIDFAFLDIQLGRPGANVKTGIDVLKYIRASERDVRAIMLSIDEDQKTIDKCLNEGASGYIIKKTGSPSGLNVMRDALLAVINNQIYVPISGTPSNLPEMPHLTPREWDLIYYICQGDTHKVIARKMGFSDGHSRASTSTVCKKFKCHNKSALMSIICRLGIHLPKPKARD